jgi:hypothetical protein
MSALQILLDDLVDGVWPVVPAPFAPWWLTLDDEVVIALFEDETSASILLCASPGYLHRTSQDSPASSDASWTDEAIDHDLAPGASRLLRVDPATGIVMISESWPRAALDSVCFRGRLAYFADACRYWSGLLHPAPAPQKLIFLTHSPN